MEPAPQREGHVCRCGKTYVTEGGLKQHKRRYCRARTPPAEEVGPQPQIPDNICEVCGSTFKNFAGKRQHLRVAHPEIYNRAVEAEAEGARDPWSRLEVLRLAQDEARYEGKFVNQYLATKSERSLDAIKGRRRRDSYKRLVSRLRQEASEAPDEPDVQAPRYIEPEAGAVEEGVVEEHLLNPADFIDHAGRERAAAERDAARDPILRYLTNLDLNDNQKALVNILLAGENGADAIDAYVQALCGSVGGEGASHRKTTNGRNANKNRKDVRRGKSAGRAGDYKLAQQLFNNNRARLSNAILDGIPLVAGQNLGPPIAEVENTYRDLYCVPAPNDFERFTAKDNEEGPHLDAPISIEEIELAIRCSKSDSPGPDGLKKKHLNGIGSTALCVLFNAMLQTGHIPAVLKSCRTILIPKSGDLNNIKNWRPITISSIVMRVCNRILAKRLSTLPFNEGQRGFRKIDGCLANNLCLQGILKEHRRLAREHHVATLDLRRAFDTVSHGSVLRALRRFNVSEKLINFIASSYDGAATAITFGKHTTAQMPIRRGVKQGDPLSPLLFNMILDELLDGIPNEAGLSFGGSKISAMAYADDLILLANSTSAMKELIRHCVGFFRKRGLDINAEKSSSLAMRVVPSKKKLYAVSTPLHYIDGKPLRQITPGQQVRYLGHSYSYDGMEKFDTNTVKTMLENVTRAPLKPHQKLILIKQHLIPRILYTLQSPTITKGILRGVDRMIRVAVRRILHLNRTCAEAYLHADTKGGGLGIMPLVHAIPRILYTRISKLEDSGEPLVTAITQARPVQKLKSRLLRMLGGLSSKMEQLRYWRDRLETSYSGGGLIQGVGLPHSGAWINSPPRYWTAKEFVQAVQLKGNLLPSRGIPSNPPAERKCRAGCDRTESLSHILQRCPVSHWSRVRRHDQVVDRLGRILLAKKWTTQVEPHVRLADGQLRKPDLILKRDGEVVICDVAVPWEGPQDMGLTYTHKIAYYGEEAMTTAVQKIFPGCNITVAPLVIGARGTWCELNRTIVQKTKLTTNDIERLTHVAILGSLKTYRQFMMTTWRVRPTFGR